MAYEKIGWKDYPDKTTPINAQNLNHMDDQIAANAEKNDTQDQAIQKNENDISELNLKMEVVKYSTVQSANLEYISNVGGYIWKQGNVCYMGVTFTILKTRSVSSLFKFPDYLAPKDASVIGHIYNNNVEAVCGFLFPTKSHANYNNGFIRNQASLSPGAYMLRATWIDV